MRKHKGLALAVGTVLVTFAFVVAYRIRRLREDPSALPYSQRLWTEFPRPILTRTRLREMLGPVGGQRVLEVGPGTGYYALRVAGWLSPDGTLEILDIQQQMLDHTVRRAHETGVENITATQGDARALPYPDNAFDAAYLVATLGEIPDRERALAELRRVLKPGGRLVVGEGQPDPHMVGFRTLKELTDAAGFAFERRTGGCLGHFASFEAP